MPEPYRPRAPCRLGAWPTPSRLACQCAGVDVQTRWSFWARSFSASSARRSVDVQTRWSCWPRAVCIVRGVARSSLIPWLAPRVRTPAESSLTWAVEIRTRLERVGVVRWGVDPRPVRPDRARRGEVLDVLVWAEFRRTWEEVEGLSIREIAPRRATSAIRCAGRSAVRARRTMSAGPVPRSSIPSGRTSTGYSATTLDCRASGCWRSSRGLGCEGSKTILYDYLREIRPQFLEARTY
jgi:hypothetical protein